MRGVMGDLMARVPQAADDSVIAARARRLAQAKIDFFFFCQTYLGAAADPTKEAAFSADFADYQRLLLRVVSRRRLLESDKALLLDLIKPEYWRYFERFPAEQELAGLLDIEPREHGKTTRNGQALPLWLALTQERTFPVLIAGSANEAQTLLASIKFELENNGLLIEDFGDQRSRTWNKRKIVLANGNAIAAVGAGQTLRGIKERYRRPTHVICDDLLKDREIESRRLRDTLDMWFRRVVLNLGKGALTLLVNTILHPDDLPNRLLAQIQAGTLVGWVGLRFSCFVQDEEQRGPLWPAKWSRIALHEKRLTLGPFVFATEWRNETIPEESRKFRAEWFQFYLPHQIDRRELKRVTGCDPATGTAGGDFGAIITLGKCTRSGLIYVLDVWLERVSELAYARAIIEVFAQWQPAQVRFEDRAFQAIYKRLVAREAARLGVRLPLTGFKGGNKELRLLSLAPLIENGVLRFVEDRHKALIDQFLEFPRGHDDGPDALEMALSGLEGRYLGGAPIGQRYGLTVAERLARAFGGGNAL